MKTLPLIAVLLLAAPAILFAQTALPPPVEEVRSDILEIGAFYPRFEGSEGERKAIAFIERRIAALGHRFSLSDFSESDVNHSFSSNIEVDVPGKLKDTLIIVVPLNHPQKATVDADGATNIALALSLLKQVTVAPLPVSLKFVFLGAEAGEGDEYPMGSTLFLRDFHPDFKVIVLYLNLKKIPSRLLIRGGGKGIVSPYWLISELLASLANTNIPFLIRGNENQIFRMGLTDEKTIIEPFLKAGYPACSLEGEYGPVSPSEAENWLFSFHVFFSQLIESNAKGIPEQWDRHFLFFQAKDFSLIFDEKTYLSILIFLLMGVLLVNLLFPSGVKKYVRILAKNFLSLPVITALSFLILLLATLAIKAILAARNFPDLWAQRPLLFLALKLSLSLLLLSALSNGLRKLPFSKNGSFYSAASLLFLIIDIFALSLFDISFTYYFLWAFAFAFLAILARNRFLKVLLFLPSPFWIVKATVELFTLPRLAFCRLFLVSEIPGNLSITLIAVPFVLLIIRLGLLFPPIGLRRTRTYLIVSLSAVVSLALAGYLSIFTPFTPANPQPVMVSQFIDTDKKVNRLEISSPAPLGKLAVSQAGIWFPIETGSRSFSLSLEGIPDLLQIQSTSSQFLNRKNVNLNLLSPGKPLKITMDLSSSEDFTLFDCTFPFLRQPLEGEYRIMIGANPPIPLPIQLTLPQAMTFTLRVTVEYADPTLAYELTGRELDINTHLTVKKTLIIKT